VDLKKMVLNVLDVKVNLPLITNTRNFSIQQFL